MPVFLTAIRSCHRPALATLVCLVSLAGGCGLVKDRSDSYQQAELAGDVKMPEWFTAEPIEPIYPIPEAGKSGFSQGGDTTIPEPPDLTGNILDQNYVVESAGEQSWLLVNELPGRVWPSVVRFLLDQGLELDYENPRIGLMQTGPADFSLRAREWLELPNEASATQTVVQARVSPGVRRRTTEVQLRLRAADAPVEEFLQWDPQSDYPAREKRLLETMADSLKAEENVKSYSRAALDIAEDPRVRLVTPESGQPRIELDLNYDRAWAEVTRALDEGDVPVVDINRSEGLWYVDYRSDDERTQGWFFWKSLDEARYTFQVEMQRDESGLLHVTTRRAPDYEGSDRSERLLSEIYEHLY